MNVDRFVSVGLQVHKEMPSATDLDQLLDELGMTHSTQERLWVISYDSILNIRTVDEIVVGGYHEVVVPLPPLLTAVLAAGTDRFRIAHNHPSGDTQPTIFDVDMVHKIMEAANLCGLYFEDSLIVGPEAETFSFLDAGMILLPDDVVTMSGGGHTRVPFTKVPVVTG